MRTGPVLFAGLFLLRVMTGAAFAEDVHTIGDVQDKIIIAGGVDVVGLDSLDLVAVMPDRMLMNHICDPLLRTDAEGNLEPWLVTSWKNIDPLTWELKLRQNVRFQDGEPFNAATVKFLYDTMNDPNFISPVKSNNDWVARTEIVDDYTVRLTTKEPYAAAMGQLTLAHVLPPDYIKKVGFDGYRRRPIGTGPYRLTESVRDDHITLEANDDWWAGKPKVRTIVYRPIKEESARVAALLTHEIDVAFDVPPELVPVVQSGKDLSIKRALSTRVYMLAFNTLDKSYPTMKPAVREAINYAIDRDGLNKAIFAGTGAPAAWLNPTTFGIDPSLKPVSYDPERAKALLAEAGYPNGLDLVMDTPAGHYIKDKEYGEAIAGQLAKAGIRADVHPLEWGVFTKRVLSHQSSPVTLLTWGDNVNDPDIQNYRLLQTGGAWSQNNDPDLDALLNKIKSEMDPEKRKALIFEEQHYMRQSYPVAYLEQIGELVGTSSKLAWWQPRSNDAHWFYRVNTD